MRRPLFVFCLLATACIRMGCGLNIFPDGREPVGQVGQLLLREEVPLIQGRVCEKDPQFIYVESLAIMEAAMEQQEEYQAIPASSSASFTIPKKIKVKCEYSQQEHGEQPKLGSTVLVTGEFVPFSRAGNPGQFDARDYYEGQNICGQLKDCQVLQESVDYSGLLEGLRRLRRQCSDRIYRLLPAKEASMLNTILLGEKQAMDDELKEVYRNAGILHIASISGLHVMLIAMSIYQLLRRLGASIGISGVVSSILLVLYGIMTGMSTSSVRAIAMFLIRMLGLVIGRTYDMLTALGLVGVIMVISHPLYLQDAGFLLSFGAVLGIGVLCPVFKMREEKRLVMRRVFSPGMVRLWKILGKNLAGVRDSFYSCTAVNLVLLPILLWYYYEVPVYSWILNLLIIPSLSVLVAIGCGLMATPALGFLVPVETELLRLYENLCQWTQKWPGHTWNPGRPEGWTVVVYYLVLGLLVWWKRRGVHAWVERNCDRILVGVQEKARIANRKLCFQEKMKVLLVGGMMRHIRLLFIVLLMFGICLLGYHPRENRVTFLDVGQGDCICVETASGQVYLFDCGSSSQSKVGQYVLKPYLKYYGINEIDGLFLSHPDSDHCNGAVELLENQEEWGIIVKQLFLPERTGKQASSGQIGQEWSEILAAARCHVEYVSAGDIAKAENIKLLCLHPGIRQDYKDGNQASQCFYLEVVGETQSLLRVLLTGDVEGAGEVQLREVLADYGITQVDVLKVAHHGSKNGTSEEFLQRIDAEIAVISCGERNVYGHPHGETLERLNRDGAVVMTTPERGAIVIKIGKELRVHGFKE